MHRRRRFFIVPRPTLEEIDVGSCVLSQYYSTFTQVNNNNNNNRKTNYNFHVSRPNSCRLLICERAAVYMLNTASPPSPLRNVSFVILCARCIVLRLFWCTQTRWIFFIYTFDLFERSKLSSCSCAMRICAIIALYQMDAAKTCFGWFSFPFWMYTMLSNFFSASYSHFVCIDLLPPPPIVIVADKNRFQA